MTATTATDPSGPIEYYFENTTNGNFRGWSTSRDWTYADGLTPGQTYGYRVKARDALSNETAWSALAFAFGITETNPPSPDPMTFATAPMPFGSTRIFMVATEAVDPSGPVEYYFDETTGLGILSTANYDGQVDAAVYSRPHVMENGTVAFIMMISELLETRTALGARASIESLIKLTPVIQVC